MLSRTESLTCSASWMTSRAAFKLCWRTKSVRSVLRNAAARIRTAFSSHGILSDIRLLSSTANLGPSGSSRSLAEAARTNNSGGPSRHAIAALFPLEAREDSGNEEGEPEAHQDEDQHHFHDFWQLFHLPHLNRALSRRSVQLARNLVGELGRLLGGIVRIGYVDLLAKERLDTGGIVALK